MNEGKGSATTLTNTRYKLLESVITVQPHSQTLSCANCKQWKAAWGLGMRLGTVVVLQEAEVDL